MSRIAIVLSVERVQDDGGHGADIKCEPRGGDPVTAPHFADPGDDSLPLVGDSVGLSDSNDSGSAEHATSYADTKNAGKAKPGEKRIYARDASGNVVASVYLKNDGTAEIECVSLTIKGDVRIEGKLDVTGEVTAKSDTTPNTLTGHVHLTGFGPTQKPTPGT